MAKIGAKELPAIIAGKAIWHYAQLLAAGVTRRQVHYLVETGKLTRIAHGILATSEAEAHPRVQDAVACLVTGGVICGRTAGFRHGLTDDIPPEIEILVPHGSSHHPLTQPVRLLQSRNPTSFTLGVDVQTILGVEVRMTNRARTVVDLVRGPIRQHGVAAVHTFLAEGGTGAELDAMARPFGVRDEVGLLVEGTLQAMSRAHGP